MAKISTINCATAENGCRFLCSACGHIHAHGAVPRSARFALP
jgi:hypothetical protein